MHKEILFETPAWFELKENFLEPLTKITDEYIDKAKHRLKEISKQTNDFGFSYHSTSLLEDNRFNDFHKYVNETSLKFLDEQGFDMSLYNTQVIESWVQEFCKNGGGHHAGHVHPDTHVSGFYFLKGSEKTSCPVLQDPRNGARVLKLKEKNLEALTSASDKVHFTVQPGIFLFIPGYIPHEYVVDRGIKPFRFIHFTVRAHEKI